jgi:exopolysaccharide production protein ExoQ
LTESRASKLAFVASLMTIFAATIAPRLVYHGLQGLIILLPAWPFAASWSFVHFQNRLFYLPESWRARVEIWDYISYRIFEHPWLGWGLGTSKLLDYKNPHGNLYRLVTDHAPHPHNVVLQLWVELGLPGLALGIAFAFLTLRQANRVSAPLVPFALGAWVAALCLSLVAYSFWTDSLFAAFALTGFAFALLERQPLTKRG